MPLIKSGSKAAVSQNIREMMHAGHPQKQAIAAALSNARKYGAKMQGGGFAAPLGERIAARSLMHQGFLHSAVPGRTDKLPITVGGGAYVLPADHLAAIGQGNSQAGAHIVGKMFGMGPFGMAPSPMHAARSPQPRLKMKADGGEVDDKTRRKGLTMLRGEMQEEIDPREGQHYRDAMYNAMRAGEGIRQYRSIDLTPEARGGSTAGKPTPIIAAGGEFVIPPEAIIRKFGSLDKGHKALDAWVMNTRKKHISQLKNLKPPKKD